MALFWISLPSQWQLQDVQAGLNVIIAILSAIATWCLVRFCWQIGTHRIRNHGSTPLSSLFTMNTLGEVFDAVSLLKLRILSRQHHLLLFQCCLVCTFAATTMLSGPIVRMSTRIGGRTTVMETPVYPAIKAFDIIACANTYWADIDDSLTKANFPHDRLLDFLPDTNVNWTYVPEQWTRTWSLQCDQIPRTSIKMMSTGHCLGNTVPATVPTIYEGMPGLYSVFNMSEFAVSAYDWSGFWVTNRNPVQNMLMFLYGHNLIDVDPQTGTVYGMNFSIASVHFRDIQKSLTVPNDCRYAAGPIGSTTYTRVNCALRRERKVPDEKAIPFPDSVDSNVIARQININYQGRFMIEAATNSTITDIMPDDLIRFYQVYTISKDTQYRQAIMRSLTVIQRVPQFSSAFLAPIAIIATMCIAISSSWWIFRMHHYGVDEVPLTKLDWLLHTISPENLNHRTSRHLPISMASQGGGMGHGEPTLLHTEHEHTHVERFESAAYVKDLPRTNRFDDTHAFSFIRPRSRDSSCGKNSVYSAHDSVVMGLSDEAHYTDSALRVPHSVLGS